MQSMSDRLPVHLTCEVLLRSRNSQKQRNSQLHMDKSSLHMFKLFEPFKRSHMAGTSVPTDGTSATPNDGSSGVQNNLRTPATDISCGEKVPLAGEYI